MPKNKFQVIIGGAAEEEGDDAFNRVFISSYVTDTRFMGAIVLHIHWKLIGKNIFDLHQFFYYDPEDEGLETYKSMLGNDFAALKAIENSLLGGLGSSKVNLSEMQARCLFWQYSQTNIKNNKPFPEERSEYEFLFDKNVFADMTDEEKQHTISKTCTPITNENQAINYFLMRAYAKDEEGIALLCNKNCSVKDYLKNPKSDLCKNTIETFEDEKGKSYLCESLLEEHNQYKIAVSEVTLGKSFKVRTAKILSSFYVSMAEAAMMMAKPEYVTCYDIIDYGTSPSGASHINFMEYFHKFVQGSLATEHEDGSLFIVFSDNNAHVSRSEYRLNDDLYCIYYISSFDQLLVTAYNPFVILKIEEALENSKAGQYILPLSKYQFKEPMVYEFIQSDFDDFEEFVEAMLFSDDPERPDD